MARTKPSKQLSRKVPSDCSRSAAQEHRRAAAGIPQRALPRSSRGHEPLLKSIEKIIGKRALFFQWGTTGRFTLRLDAEH